MLGELTTWPSARSFRMAPLSRHVALAVTLAFAALLPRPAASQSTDGYFSMQVVPVVVDTALFAQRFTFQNAQETDLSLKIKYFPATGTTATAIQCPALFVALGGQRTITSLRALCPALPAGSQFGFLTITDQSPVNTGMNVFSVYTRVSNAAGAGFSVEGFPATTFTSADATITGLRRLAATSGAPAYQTNCFFANMDRLDGQPPVDMSVHYALYDSTNFLHGAGDLVLPAGGFVRYLDIFAQAGSPAGDHNDWWMRVNPTNRAVGAGLIAFCTVQDNTSFGADFRIAKMAAAVTPLSGGMPTVGAKDLLATRNIVRDHDRLGRPFEIPPGSFSNTHVLYVRQPDFINCELINPATGLRALPAYGLEMRVADSTDESTVLGGNNAVVLPETGQSIYIGDKPGGSDGASANAWPIIEVESNEQNTAANRPYTLHCRSGNGATGLDVIRYKEAIDRF